MNSIFTDGSFSSVFVFLFISIFLFLVFRLFHKVNHLFNLKPSIQNNIRSYLSIFETGIWLLFLIWGVAFFIDKYPIYAIGLGFVVLIFIFLISRYALIDVICGAFIKINRHIQKNQMININGIEGKIMKIGLRTIWLEGNKGEIIELAYSQIIHKPIVISSPAQMILNHSFVIDVFTKKTLIELISDVKNSIRELPWASLKKEPQVKLKQTLEQGYKLEITVFSIDEKYLRVIEKHIKNMYN